MCSPLSTHRLNITAAIFSSLLVYVSLPQESVDRCPPPIIRACSFDPGRRKEGVYAMKERERESFAYKKLLYMKKVLLLL